jgi:hypothetical protein
MADRLETNQPLGITESSHGWVKQPGERSEEDRNRIFPGGSGVYRKYSRF